MSIIKTWVLLIIIFGLSCSDEISESSPASSTKSASSSALPNPEATSVVPTENKAAWAYSPIGKRDPFRSYLAILEESGEKEKTGQKIIETTLYELDQYKLKGLITSTAQPKAMVEDPQGRGWVIKLGSRLGKAGGVVTRISREGIIVTEEFRSPTGERVRQPITIKLPRPETDLMGEQK